ncbi:MAG: hypothetical protein RBT60_00335 [Candidatus Krumholzibacteria bacterium]|nr:hypothetical protein [Candidatus Krumholzibacteria bacterium]
MKTLVAVVIASLWIAGGALAQTQVCYGWEDGGTALGEFGSVNYFVDSTHVSEGSYALAIEETGSGTGQIYVAWITNLIEGDEVTVSFDVYDGSLLEGDSVYPRTRIWAHYSFADDIDGYDGSAGGNDTYSDGYGWNNLSFTWVIPEGKVALVIEARPYGVDPFDQGYNWLDNLCVSAPEGAWVYFPGGTVGTQQSSLSAVKALFR